MRELQRAQGRTDRAGNARRRDRLLNAALMPDSGPGGIVYRGRERTRRPEVAAVDPRAVAVVTAAVRAAVAMTEKMSLVARFAAACSAWAFEIVRLSIKDSLALEPACHLRRRAADFRSHRRGDRTATRVSAGRGVI
jgi:hypothetical protein